MENFYEFAAEHPFLAFLIIVVICDTIVRVFRR